MSGQIKMAMMMYDHHLSNMIRKKKDFILNVTSYTRMIKEQGKPIVLFANDFKGSNQFLLPLINKVRNDGKSYLEGNFLGSKDPIDYSALLDNPVKPRSICKVDINGAYWNYGVKRGIITEPTNEYCDKVHEGADYEQLKKTRLKCFGSLATRKVIHHFFDGVEDQEKKIDKTEPTRDLYIDVCRGIDNLMKGCAREVKGCVYYYWDCMFVDSRFAPDVVEYFKSLQYDCTVNETSLDYVIVGEHGYLISKVDGKMYLVKKEDKHLLYN